MKINVTINNNIHCDDNIFFLNNEVQRKCFS